MSTTNHFHPLIAHWFNQRFGEPTQPQTRGWPSIASGKHTLIAAPTGSGKTLAAFLVCLDRLHRQWFEGTLERGIQVVYVSPLKALSNDIQRNLQQPLAELRELAEQQGISPAPIETALRTGDTTSSQRAAIVKKPPHILVTTPESLYLMLTSEKARERLRTVNTVIVDEIHALARDKRGSHLSLTLERLSALCDRPPVRIGLSATQRPIEQIAQFLVGVGGEQIPRPLPPDAAELLFPATATQSTLPGFESHVGWAPPTTNDQLPAEHGGQCPPYHASNPKRQRDTTSSSPLTSPLSPDLASEGGSSQTTSGRQCPPYEAPRCTIIDGGHQRDLQLEIEVPPSELSAVCSHDQWAEVFTRLCDLINSHRSTLVFVNTRRLAERVAHHLRELLGEEAVASHHGSMSKETRHSAEQRLKAGELKAIVATASLEMGIDIGYIDQVCQIGSPRSISAFLQRVGRSGHSIGATPQGRLFPLTRDELLECLALVRAVRRGRLDSIEIPVAPLDILAQQVVAATAIDDWEEGELFDLFRRASPFRNLDRGDFERILRMLHEGVAASSKKGAYLHRDQIHGRLRARRGARITATTNGGAIPEAAEFRVVTEEDRTVVGSIDEHYAVDSSPGDVFLLGNTSWRIKGVRGSEVIVNDAAGLPPSVPFWFGEGLGRTIELSQELASLRADLAGKGETLNDPLHYLMQHCGATSWGAEQAVRYVAAQTAAIEVMPTCDDVVFERFFDESGGMQLVIHAPFGQRINRAWGLSLRKRFCRSFDFELQAVADDNGIVLSLSPQHSFAIENLFKMLTRDNGRFLLKQALLAQPLFQTRWRWNVTRALVVHRFNSGKKVPPHLQRFRSDDLLAAVFPETVGCLENHHGDVEIPDHPLVQQTMHDCLTEATDVERWLQLLDDHQSGKVRFHGRDTREPSPFSHQLLNANPYAFLDPADLEERRTRAVSTRRSLSSEAFQDLARLDPEAIVHVVSQAWPIVRDAEEAHDCLLNMVLLWESEVGPWQAWLEHLAGKGRAVQMHSDALPTAWTAAEHVPLLSAVYPAAKFTPQVKLPPQLQQEWSKSDGWVALARGRMQYSPPTTAAELASRFGLEASSMAAALEALEASGIVLRGSFTAEAQAANRNGSLSNAQHAQWCDRRLLARIHRTTLDGLRRQIQPVKVEDFLRYLAGYHRLTGSSQCNGTAGAQEVLGMLQGFEAPAGAWESRLLAPRLDRYDPAWLDGLFTSGAAIWGRLQVPQREPAKSKARRGAMTRAAPLSLLLRDDLPWLIEGEPSDDITGLTDEATMVYQALQQRGALFLQELKHVTELLPAQLDDALRELATSGRVTSDAFTAIREIVVKKRKNSFGPAPAQPLAGRWSCFPGLVTPLAGETRIEQWCHQLLRRYGVIFRDLLARETAAPSWYEMIRTLRRLELRGEVRGGRFVAGVSGEQYATEEAVKKLRQLRDSKLDGAWAVVSAADPLNLRGVITPGDRVPATHKNALILRDGRYVAVLVAGQIEYLEEVDISTRLDMARSLRQGRRVTTAADERSGFRRRLPPGA